VASWRICLQSVPDAHAARSAVAQHDEIQGTKMTAKLRTPTNVGNDDLIDWLKDVGRRGAPKPPAPSSDPLPPVAPRARTGRGRPLLLGALAAIAALQYIYVDVFLQIAKLPKLIVFISVP
jgi:hypothetical protein